MLFYTTEYTVQLVYCIKQPISFLDATGELFIYLDAPIFKQPLTIENKGV